MANPIKASDIYVDDGAITRAIEELGRLGQQIEQVQKVAKKYADSIKTANVAQEDGRKQITEATKAADRLAKEKEKLTREYREQEKELIKLREERKKNTRQATLEIKAANAAKGSYNALSAQYSLNKQRLNEMTQAQRKAAEASEGLVTKTKEIYKEMKRLQEETGKTSLNVGNYKEAIVDAISGTKAFGAAMDVVSKTPLLAALTLIIGAVSTLFEAFRQSENGAKLLRRASFVLQGVFGLLVQKVDSLAGFLEDLFTDPIQTMKDFGSALVTEIGERLEAVSRGFAGLGKFIRGIFTRDLQLINEGAREAADGIGELFTGLNAQERKELADAVEETAAQFDKLAQAIQSARDNNRELTKSLQSVITNEEKLRFIVDDQTLSFEARKEASDELFRATEQRAAIEQQIARNNLNVINQEIALRKAQKREIEDLKDRQVDAFVAAAEADRNYTMTVQENAKARRELISDEREINLDILIDLFDNQKTINERIISNDKTTLTEKARLLKETVRLSELSFREQVKNLQAQAAVQIDIDRLVAEADATRIVQEIQAIDLSEKNKTRLIEIIKERRLAVQDLKEAEQDLAAAVNESAEAARGEIKPMKIGDIVDEEDLQFDFTAVSEGGLFSALSFGDKEQEELNKGVNFAKGKLNELTQARIQAADAAVQAASRETDAAKRALQAEIEAAEQGRAANIQARQDELAAAEQQQQEALKQRERAQKAQLAIDTVTQASSLITAASKILKDVPFPLNIAAVGTMFGSFALAKIKAFQAAKIFRDGGLEFLDYGGSHESGNDIFIGTDGHGSQMRAERGEAMAVINRKATSRYRSVLPAIIDSLNNQQFERQFSYMGQAAQQIPILSPSINFDTKRMEGHLSAIRQNGSEQYYTDSKGRMIRKRGNKRTIYV
jgi:hypothetical protein